MAYGNDTASFTKSVVVVEKLHSLLRLESCQQEGSLGVPAAPPLPRQSASAFLRSPTPRLSRRDMSSIGPLRLDCQHSGTDDCRCRSLASPKGSLRSRCS